MKYISTRGQAPALNFEEVLLTGLAPDGGLYVPETLPQFSQEEIAGWATLSYTDLAFKIVQPFIGGCIIDADLKAIIDDTYVDFRHPAIAPLVQLDQSEWVLELFQGPTLAFKDFALQMLGRLLDYVLERKHQKAVIMGAELECWRSRLTLSGQNPPPKIMFAINKSRHQPLRWKRLSIPSSPLSLTS